MSSMLRPLAALLVFGFAVGASGPALAAGSPNIVLIYADDMGWPGSSVPMESRLPASRSDFYRTPQLERRTIDTYLKRLDPSRMLFLEAEI